MKFKKLTLNEGIFDISDVDPAKYYGWGEGAYWELYQDSTNKCLLERDCTEVVYDLYSEIGKLNRPDEIFSTLGEQAIEFLVDKFDVDPEDLNLDDFEIIVYSDSYTGSCKLADLRNDLKYMFESYLSETVDPYDYDDDSIENFSLLDDLKFNDSCEWRYISCDLYKISDGRDEYCTTFELDNIYEYESSRDILQDAAHCAEDFLYEQFDFAERDNDGAYNNFKVIIDATLATNHRESYDWHEEYLLGDLFDKLNGR